MEEIWRDIYEYEGKYQVSNMGRVRSLDFTSMQPHPKTGEIHPYTYKGRMLKPHAINSGYLAVGLRDQQGKRQHLVHRLVAAAFIPNPNDLPDVNHKNEDKTDNRAENLEWCTKMYNNDIQILTALEIEKMNAEQPEEDEEECDDSYDDSYDDTSAF